MKLKIGKELRGIIVRSAAALISLIMTVSLLPLTLLASVNVPNVNSDGFYEIGTADELFWFAEQVNSGNTSVSAALTGDIDPDRRRRMGVFGDIRRKRSYGYRTFGNGGRRFVRYVRKMRRRRNSEFLGLRKYHRLFFADRCRNGGRG